MKKSIVAILIVITIVLSGVAGFGGRYFADIIADSPLAQNEEIASPAPEDNSIPTPTFDISAEQINKYIEEYLASKTKENEPDGEAAHNEAILGKPTLLSNVNELASRKQLTIPEIAAVASSSVVEIYTESVANGGRMGQYITGGAGSGVIVTADGYIITNNHVIEGSRKITVRLNNGKDYEATLIGRDSKTDIAVIKIKAGEVKAATFGNSDNLVVGELAVAIGNPLGELGGTVTEGVISALSRNIDIDGNAMTLLQTSAAVNPGNSGGGLFNNYGELIGVVNAKSSGSDIEGIGFAIPGNLAKYIAESLMKYGYVPGRIDLGLTLVNVLDPMTAMMYRVQSTGVYVSQADTDSQLRSGDRIISINDKNITSITDINVLLENLKVGDTLSVVISRGGSTMTVQHTLRQAKV